MRPVLVASREPAGEDHDVGHGRILADDLRELLEPLPHRLERTGLVGRESSRI